jgi:hypothetical protein
VEGLFSPGRDTVLARVAGDGLRALDVRDGDHVVLARREHANHGDLAAVLDAAGHAFLWKVYPEADGPEGPERLRLSSGPPALDRLADPGSRVHGVVVAVLRRGEARRPAEPKTTSLEAEVAHDH